MASELELDDAVAPGTLPGGKLRLDLLGVDFVDSAGLSLLLTLHRRAIDEGFSLTLTRVPVHIARVFGVAGLDRELPWEAFGEEL